MYVATDHGELVALDSKTLSVTGTYSTSGQEFTSSPVVFPYRGKNLIAAATKDGRIHVLDGASLSQSGRAGSNPKAFGITAAYSNDGSFAPGALATWQAPDGTRWLLAAVHGPPAQTSGFSTSGGPISNGAVAAWGLGRRFENEQIQLNVATI